MEWPTAYTLFSRYIISRSWMSTLEVDARVPRMWCPTREFWFGWSRAQLTQRTAERGWLSVSVCKPPGCR